MYEGPLTIKWIRAPQWTPLSSVLVLSAGDAPMEETADAARTYRKLAKELREKALRMTDPHSRAVMLSAAAEVIENTARDLNIVL